MKNIKISLSVPPEAEQEKNRSMNFFNSFELASSNFLIQNQNISFSPRGAWQILSKSALGARSAPAEPAEGGRSLALNSEIFKMRYLLDEIRTFFTDNPDTDF
jgi:hypothetical protein